MKADFSFLRACAAKTKATEPRLWHLAQPRRIVPPLGYANPDCYSELLCAQIATAPKTPKGAWDKTMIDTVLTAWKLVESEVPTFFIGADFLTELAWTDPPRDMAFSEMLWPHEAMLLVLPESFHEKYFPRPTPFITVAKSKEGLQGPPEIVRKLIPWWNEKIGIVDPNSKADECFICSGSVFFGRHSVDYAGSWPTDVKIGEALDDKEFAFEAHGQESYVEPALRPTHEEDLRLINRITALGTIILLGMMAAPEYIERNGIMRPVRIRNGTVEKEELWHPNLIGFKYKILPGPPQGGTHASPRPHWRRGHMHRYRHGPGRAQIKLQWTKRTPIRYPKAQSTIDPNEKANAGNEKKLPELPVSK